MPEQPLPTGIITYPGYFSASEQHQLKNLPSPLPKQYMESYYSSPRSRLPPMRCHRCPLSCSIGFPFFPPTPTRHHISPTAPKHHPTALETTTHVLVRHTAAAPPLTPLYDGPYLVTARAPTHFTLQVGNRTEIVSIDRLKPAVLPTNTPPAEPLVYI